MENDFLLLTLRRLLPKGGGGGGGGGSGGEGGGGAGFNLCLMSATMDGDVLSDYFRTGLGAAVPRVAFPGRTFPVTALYLEDVLRLTGHRANPRADWGVQSVASQRRLEKVAADARSAARAKAAADGEEEVDGREAAEEGAYPEGLPSARDLTRRLGPKGVSEAVCEEMAAMDPQLLNIDLIADAVIWYVRGAAAAAPGGAEGGQDVGYAGFGDMELEEDDWWDEDLSEESTTTTSLNPDTTTRDKTTSMPKPEDAMF